MRHSVRNTPICGNSCTRSDRDFKTIWHRAWRRTNKQRVRGGREPITLRAYAPANRRVSDKDGKHWYGVLMPYSGWYMRFTVGEHLARHQQMCQRLRRK